MKHRVCILVLAIAFAGSSPAGEIYQDFRGKDLDETLFRLQGAETASRIQTEPLGLRITIPPGPKAATAGVTLRPATTGDFQITVGYEILEAERPMAGNGVGLEMYLNTSNAAQDALVFYRVARPKEGDVYMCEKKTTIDGKRETTRRTFPADSKSGQLLLKRAGNEMTFAAVEGPNGVPQELCRYDWVPVDLHISVRAWGSHNPVDLRLTEIRVRDQSDAEPVVSSEAPPPARRRALLVVGLVAAIFLAAGGLFAWRQLAGRGTRTATAAADSMTFFCATCGKQLKASTLSRGKTVPCPACGQPAPVPRTRSGGAAAGQG